MTRDRAVPAVARWCARARRRSPFAGDADALFETDAEKSARHEKARITKVSGPHLAALEATRLPAITGRAVRDIMAECADIAASARSVGCVCVWKWGEVGRDILFSGRKRYFAAGKRAFFDLLPQSAVFDPNPKSRKAHARFPIFGRAPLGARDGVA